MLSTSHPRLATADMLRGFNMHRRTIVRGIGLLAAGLALTAFAALSAFAEPPSHGFHAHKPHAGHPSPNPPPGGHKPHAGHPTLNPPPSGHVPHVAHKPHPELNPFAPPKP